jgi:hypothetical protein
MDKTKQVYAGNDRMTLSELGYKNSGSHFKILKKQASIMKS